MTWVKICGMTNLEDALVAVEAGADAVGFVFYEKSPRCVTVETAREICSKLPESVEKVGVFVGDSLTRAEETGPSVGLDGLQVYTTSGPRILEILENVGAWPPSRRKPGQTGIYMALPISQIMVEQVEEQGLTVEMQDPEGECVALLLDSGSGQRPGGTGVAFDWNRAAPTVAHLSLRHRVVIAGGLTPQNVGGAMSILKPWGVDVSSGVEARPGKKDAEKVRAFVRAVRQMDRKGS
ncbi:MAG: phosphoribosylanthranilate isomerase [Candidatus Sulfotelmatobacter sp.]